MPRYIDADKLIAEFEWILSQKSRFNRSETEDVLERIRKTPTEDVAPVAHAHWIEKSTGSYGRWQSWCSACGEHSGIGGIESNRHKAYCPNCGAKMEEEEG